MKYSTFFFHTVFDIQSLSHTYSTSEFVLVTLQVLHSCVRLVAAILDSTSLENCAVVLLEFSFLSLPDLEYNKKSPQLHVGDKFR